MEQRAPCGMTMTLHRSEPILIILVTAISSQKGKIYQYYTGLPRAHLFRDRRLPTLLPRGSEGRWADPRAVAVLDEFAGLPLQGPGNESEQRNFADVGT